MGRRRKKLIHLSEKFHMSIHVLWGIIIALVIKKFIVDVSLFLLLLTGILGSLLPDFDHVLYIFIYGRKSEYSRFIRHFISQKQLKKTFWFCKNNHKLNTGLYSHNILTMILVLILSINAITIKNYFLTTFFLAWSMHYLYDIFEDLLFFGKINKNWFLKFDKKIINKDLLRF